VDRHSNWLGIKIQSKILVKEGLQIEDTFAEAVFNYFNASVENVDFLSPDMCNYLNDWVAEISGNSDRNLVHPGILSKKYEKL
jgi:serine protease inhibitor